MFIEAVHFGFASDCNMCCYKVFIPSSGKIIVPYQAKFDEDV